MGEQTVILEGLAACKQHCFLMLCNHLMLSQGLTEKALQRTKKRKETRCRLNSQYNASVRHSYIMK